jgi:hypothetical protein
MTARSLAGATILQLVPALRDDPVDHAAIEIALALLQSGARAMIAGDGGALVGELRAFGGEWLPMTVDTLNPLRLYANDWRTHFQRAYRHRTCALRGRGVERDTGERPSAGFPGNVVSGSGARQ